ncbi:MAG TPA: ferrous iron transport protein A [Methanoculleus sp.]|nr:ferrous iron transport protein A [Methanoculleus sp.]
MHLAEVSSGESARIIAIEGGQGLRQQLALRGLAEGRVVTRISGPFGPVVLRINHDTIVIGRGMAQKIRVGRT